MSKQRGISKIIPPELFEETTTPFDDTATPIWAVAVEAVGGWDWQQSVCVEIELDALNALSDYRDWQRLVAGCEVVIDGT